MMQNQKPVKGEKSRGMAHEEQILIPIYAMPIIILHPKPLGTLQAQGVPDQFVSPKETPVHKSRDAIPDFVLASVPEPILTLLDKDYLNIVELTFMPKSGEKSFAGSKVYAVKIAKSAYDELTSRGLINIQPLATLKDGEKPDFIYGSGSINIGDLHPMPAKSSSTGQNSLQSFQTQKISLDQLIEARRFSQSVPLDSVPITPGFLDADGKVTGKPITTGDLYLSALAKKLELKTSPDGTEEIVGAVTDLKESFLADRWLRPYIPNSFDIKVGELITYLDWLKRLEKNNPDLKPLIDELLKKGEEIVAFRNAIISDMFALKLKRASDTDPYRRWFARNFASLEGTLSIGYAWVLGEKTAGFSTRDAYELQSGAYMDKYVISPLEQKNRATLEAFDMFSNSFYSLCSSYCEMAKFVISRSSSLSALIGMSRLEQNGKTQRISEFDLEGPASIEQLRETQRQFKEISDNFTVSQIDTRAYLNVLTSNLSAYLSDNRFNAFLEHTAKFNLSVALVPLTGPLLKSILSPIEAGVSYLAGRAAPYVPSWLMATAQFFGKELTTKAVLTNLSFGLIFDSTIGEKRFNQAYSGWLDGRASFTDVLQSVGVDWYEMTKDMYLFDAGLGILGKTGKTLFRLPFVQRTVKGAVRVQFEKAVWELYEKTMRLEITNRLAEVLKSRALKRFPELASELKPELSESISKIVSSRLTNPSQIASILGKEIRQLSPQQQKELCEWMAQTMKEGTEAAKKSIREADVPGGLLYHSVNWTDRFARALKETKNPLLKATGEKWLSLTPGQKLVTITLPPAIGVAAYEKESLESQGKAKEQDAYNKEISRLAAEARKENETAAYGVLSLLFPEMITFPEEGDGYMLKKRAFELKLSEGAISSEEVRAVKSDSVEYLMGEVRDIYEETRMGSKRKEHNNSVVELLMSQATEKEQDELYENALNYLQTNKIK